MLSPAWHAALRMAVGCLAIFSMSGVIFGVNAIDEFLYASTGLPQSDRAEPASAFAIMASAAFFSADASGALWGELTDRTSALVTLGLSSALSFVSFLLLAAGIRAAARSLITAALVGTGLAGPGILQAVFVGLLRSPVDGEPAWLTAQLGTAIAASFDLSALVLRLPELLSLSSPAGVATFLCVGLCQPRRGRHDSDTHSPPPRTVRVGVHARSGGNQQRRRPDKAADDPI